MDGIKKKPGMPRLFSTRKKVRGSGNEERGGRKEKGMQAAAYGNSSGHCDREREG
jgi:hypothetical protein